MKWDAAEHLGTREDLRLYLAACAEKDPGHGSLIRAALNAIARAQNMSLLARDAGVSREGRYKVPSEVDNSRPPSQWVYEVAARRRIRLEKGNMAPSSNAA